MDRRKMILSLGEHRTRGELKKALRGRGCEIHEKMRIADALHIDRSGLSKAEYSYALKAHFDFVVSQENRALFAVEFDDPSHWTNEKVRRRDRLKASVCEQLGMPMLRVDYSSLNADLGAFDTVVWLCDMWFGFEELCEQQSRGRLPRDEIFDLRDAIAIEDDEIVFPYDPLSGFVRTFSDLARRKVCRTGTPLYLSWHNEDESSACALVFAEVHPDTGHQGMICAGGRCRVFAFGSVLDTEFAQLIAFGRATRRFAEFERGEQTPIPISEIGSVLTDWAVPGCVFEYYGKDRYSLHFEGMRVNSGGNPR